MLEIALELLMVSLIPDFRLISYISCGQGVTKSSFTVFSASKVLNGLNAYVRSEEDWHTRAWRCGAGNSGKGVRVPDWSGWLRDQKDSYGNSWRMLIDYITGGGLKSERE